METGTANRFFENADQPDDVRHNIYLLRNLRRVKNDITKKDIQTIKSQLHRKLNDSDGEAVMSNANEIETTMTRIAHDLSAILGSQSSNRKSHPLPTSNFVSFDNSGESGSQNGLIFLSIVELLGTLYDASKDDAYFRRQERLVNILNTMKTNNVSVKEFEHLQAEFLKLCQMRSKFERMSAV